jgi:hypothetical protein
MNKGDKLVMTFGKNDPRSLGLFSQLPFLLDLTVKAF